LRCIVDSQALIWFFNNDPKLSSKAWSILSDAASILYVSPASLWEISIKLSTGKYIFAVTYEEFVQQAVYDNGFILLSIEPKHCIPLLKLPFHHRDPFDRMIIAQAMVEQLPVISSDTKIDLYPVQRIW
jgi:PIN domain nuclease of toxin-antitoxin system